MDASTQQSSSEQRGSGWTAEREALLRDLWLRGKTASDIAETLGGVSRNAVIGKAHRLKLPSRPTPTGIPGEDMTVFMEDPRDPLLEVVGGSVAAADLLKWQWGPGLPYLDGDTREVLRTAVQHALETDPQHPMVTASGIVQALQAIGRKAERKSRNWRSVVSHLSLLNVVPVPSEAPWGSDPIGADLLLRWDAVDVLTAAAGYRARLRSAAEPIELPHLIAALLGTPSGHAGLDAAQLADADLQPFKQFAASVWSDYAERLPSDGRRDIARLLLGEIGDQPRFRGPSVRRAPFASDHVDLESDALGTSRDARALADLILLEAAKPPLAIGVFGSWGSGKSTLLATLRAEINRQMKQERALIAHGETIEDPSIRRIAGVLQIEFNAWSFADSDNLWASLTSDIFEQIAAGGMDGANRKVGAKLVSEVAERTSAESAALRAAQASLQESQERIRTADNALAEAQADQRLVLVDAAFQTALELLGPKKEAKETVEQDKAAPVQQHHAPAGYNDAEPRSEQAAPDTKTSLDVFRSAVLMDKATAEERVRRYSEAGGSTARAWLMAQDYVRSRGLKWATARLTALVAFTAFVAFVGFRSAPQVMAGYAKWLMLSLLSLTAILATATVYVWPALRVASLLSAKVKERQKAAAEKRQKALADRRTAISDQQLADEALHRSRKFVEKYGAIRDVGSSTGLMLDFLLEDSSEIARLRGSLGTLGTARKAFQKLNAIVAENASDRLSPVQRIIIYIDDLDRCSEKQVVQILEAIHLLMAFPCFVVVAAVDARWLEEALRSTHRQLASDGALVTPADYLEKIFQIPFWVRRFADDLSATDGGGYGRLLNDIAGQWESVELDEDDETPPSPPAQEGRSSALVRVAPEAPDLPVPLEREPLRLSRDELRLFQIFGGIAARSPRSVKRMINIYRLIRVSSVTEDGLMKVIGEGGEQAFAPLVQFALACEAGLPLPQVALLARTLERLPGDQILDTVASFAQNPGLGVRLDAPFSEAAKACRRPIIAEDLKTAFRVAGRYSFRTPPVA